MDLKEFDYQLCDQYVMALNTARVGCWDKIS